MKRDTAENNPAEIGFVGDLTEHAGELTDKLLGVPPGGECTLYFDSPGGSPYAALSLMTILLLRDVHATGVVTGECSSAALWPLAACRQRVVTPFSVLLFHPMRWQSEEHVQLPEAAEWARHFAHLEQQMDQLLADIFGVPRERLDAWMRPGRYVSGVEFAEAGLAELLSWDDLRRRTRPAGRTGRRSGRT
ncbi:MAG: ClpP family protease [Pirellulaceae bacterium]